MLLHSVLALLVFCSALVSVHGQGSCSGYAEDPSKHEFNEQEGDHCSTEALSEKWEKEIGLSYCKLRKVLVMINTDDDHEYHPSMVEAERCVGHCSKGMACNPTSRERRRVQVTRTNTLGESKCGEVEVWDHKTCDCLNI